MLPVHIERPTLPDLRVNDPTLQIPPLPDLDVPAIEDAQFRITDPTLPDLNIPTIDALAIEQSQVYASLEEIPNLSIDTPNLAIDAPNLAPLALDPIEKRPQIGLDPIPPVQREAPDIGAQTTDIQLPPPQAISVPALHQTTNNTTENASETTEITNNINIYQQPGEDADALKDRVIDAIVRERRTGYYD